MSPIDWLVAVILVGGWGFGLAEVIRHRQKPPERLSPFPAADEQQAEPELKTRNVPRQERLR